MDNIKKSVIAFAVMMLIGVLVSYFDRYYEFNGGLIISLALSAFVGCFTYYMASKEMK